MKIAQVKNYVASNWKFIVILVLGIVTLYAFSSRILKFFGIGKTDTNKQLDDIIDKEIPELKKKVQMSQPESYWFGIAEDIYSLIGMWGDPVIGSDDKVVSLMTLVQNDLDFALLVKGFGLREEKYFWGVFESKPMSLIGFLNDDLSNKHIQKINQDYERKGIKYRI